jgi:hypothetical protein
MPRFERTLPSNDVYSITWCEDCHLVLAILDLPIVTFYVDNEKTYCENCVPAELLTHLQLWIPE